MDGWIAQARQLQKDIDQSKQAAREIVQEAEAAKSLSADVKDAGNKVKLLQEEVAYTQSVADTLEQLQICSGLLDNAKGALVEKDISLAAEKLGQANAGIKQLDQYQNSRFAGILQKRASQIKEELTARVWTEWNLLIQVHASDRKITIVDNAEQALLSLSELAQLLSRLNLMQHAVTRLHRDLDQYILAPRFTRTADGAVSLLHVDETGLSTHGRAEEQSGSDAIRDLQSVLTYINESLPEDIKGPLLDRMLPPLELQLVAEWLDPMVPVRLGQMSAFEQMLNEVSTFSSFLSTFDVAVPGDADVGQWVTRVPQTWLARRKETMLTDFRTRARNAAQDKKTGELVETQIVDDEEGQEDILSPPQVPQVPASTLNEAAEEEEEDGWGAEWTDETEDKPAAHKETSNPAEEDEDVSAWGVEDEEAPEPEPEAAPAPAPTQKTTTISAQGEKAPQIQNGDAEDENGGEEEAWGWDGEGDAEVVQSPVSSKRPAATSAATIPATPSAAQKAHKGPREITLREKYLVTGIPSVIVDLMEAILNDSSTLTSVESPLPQLRVAAPALSSLPTLLLAFYRATAQTYYLQSPTANMLIYNDVQHLLSLITHLLSTIDATHPLAKRLRLDNDIKQLSTFARRAYGREMDSQRTVLRDLLAGTSGFENCTSPINAREYKGTIEIVIERVKQVNTEWTGVLAESVKLQSVGSLLGTVVNKITADILELADDSSGISEEQSQILKGFCDQVTLLSALFEQTTPPNDSTDEVHQSGEPAPEVRDLTSVYVPGWLRFRYLAEVLEASLADIKFMWMESGLSYEFEMNEVTDLIEALFADSDYRRNALREIKSSGMGQ